MGIVDLCLNGMDASEQLSSPVNFLILCGHDMDILCSNHLPWPSMLWLPNPATVHVPPCGQDVGHRAKIPDRELLCN